MFTIHGLSEWHELELARLPDDAASLPEPACPGTLSYESRAVARVKLGAGLQRHGAASVYPERKIAAGSLGSKFSLVASECMVSMMMLNQLSRCDTTIGPKARRTLRSAVRIATPAADGEPGCRPGMRMHLSIPLETREGPTCPGIIRKQPRPFAPNRVEPM